MTRVIQSYACLRKVIYNGVEARVVGKRCAGRYEHGGLLRLRMRTPEGVPFEIDDVPEELVKEPPYRHAYAAGGWAHVSE